MIVFGSPYISGSGGSPAPIAVAPGPVPTPPGLVFCTDEDIAGQCPGDFMTLCPAWQQIASGSDGAFLSTDPWTLTTAVNLGAQGLAVGHVVALRGGSVTGSSPGRPYFSGAGNLYGVAAVTSEGVTLRQLGQPAGLGAAPAPAAGLTGVTFTVNTLAPQIVNATLDAKNEFGIDDNIFMQSTPRLYDPNGELLRYTVLKVLVDQYTNEARSDKGDYALKVKVYGAQLANVHRRLTARWIPLATGDVPQSIFSTQIRR